MAKQGIDTIDKLLYILEHRRRQMKSGADKQKLQQVIDFVERQKAMGRTLVDIIYWVNNELEEEVK